MIQAFLGKNPQVDESCWVAENAAVVGDVTLGKHVSVWYSATIRGDSASIEIGENSNIQDNAVVHVGYQVPTKIGKGVTIGHGAIVHGCTIGDNTVVGMGAIILDGAQIGANCILGAGALVTGRTVIPDGSVVMGSPAQIKREMTEKDIQMNGLNAKEYLYLLQEMKK